MRNRRIDPLFDVRFRAVLDSARRNTERLPDMNSPEFRKTFEEELKKREELTRPMLESIREAEHITEKDLSLVICSSDEPGTGPDLAAPFRTPPPRNLHGIVLD